VIIVLTAGQWLDSNQIRKKIENLSNSRIITIMVNVEYKQLKSVDFDFEKCEDGFEYIENLIKMETSNCVNALAECNKSFKNLSYVGETNEA
jgi:uncharacterized protein (DUF39 family)